MFDCGANHYSYLDAIEDLRSLMLELEQSELDAQNFQKLNANMVTQLNKANTTITQLNSRISVLNAQITSLTYQLTHKRK